jgi:hypothetical protein
VCFVGKQRSVLLVSRIIWPEVLAFPSRQHGRAWQAPKNQNKKKMVAAVKTKQPAESLFTQPGHLPHELIRLLMKKVKKTSEFVAQLILEPFVVGRRHFVQDLTHIGDGSCET